MITAKPSLSAATMPNTPGLSTLTYDVISFESRANRTRDNMDDENVRSAPQDMCDQYFCGCMGCNRIKELLCLGSSKDAKESNLSDLFKCALRKLLGEDLYKAMQTFLVHKATYLLRSEGSTSLFHLAEEDLRLGNLKFVPKGEDDEVFGMPIPNDLITNNIRNTPYYNAYLEMVAQHDQNIAAKKGGKKKPETAKQLKPKPVKENAEIHKGKSSLQLIDEDEPTQPEPEPEHLGEGDEYDVERAIQMSLESFQAQSQAHVGGVAIREPVAEATRPLPVASTGPSTQPQDDASANIVRESSSPADAETGADTDKTNSEGDTEILQIGKEQGDDVANMVNLEEKTSKIDEGQAGSDPGKTPESQPPPEQVFIDEDQARPDPGESRVALAGPDPEPIHDEFMANVVFTLELRDLPHKINQMVNEVVKEHVHVALQAPLRDRFRELPKADMKEILHQRMFESGTYKSLPEHVALYEALEASGIGASQNKERFHCSSQPPAPQSSAWKTSDTREAPSSSSKQKSDQAEAKMVKPYLQRKDRPILLNQTIVLIPTIWDLPEPENIGWKSVTYRCHDMLMESSDLVIPEVPLGWLPDGVTLTLGGPPGQQCAYGISHMVVQAQKNSTSLDTMVAYFDRRVQSESPLMRILCVISLKFYERFSSDRQNSISLNRLGCIWTFCSKTGYTIVSNCHSKGSISIYRDINDQKKMMRETEVHKFSDGTFNMILDKLDHMVKDFKMYEYNLGMET
ncbi:hypothetical protein Tco_1335859 [Tanacetum coccineum]